MFDAIADTVRTETAIHGRKGITPTELWEIVGKTVSKIASSINEKYANTPPLIDDAYKRCFWPIVLKDKRLEFYEDLDAIVEESSESQPPPKTTTESQPSTSAAPPEPAAEPEEAAVIEESQPQPVKRKAPAKAKGKGPAKKPKARAKTPARKAAKKPAKKAKKKSYNDDDDEYSSDGYEPPSDEEESTDDEEEYDEDASEEDEEDEEASEEEKAPEPVKKAINVDDLLQSNINTNYRRIKNITELSYDQARETYGARLRIVAEEELQTEQLYVGIPPTGRSLSTNLQIVLAAILQAGPHGVTQAALTKLLDLDPRSAGHYVKTLEQKGTIARKPVSDRGFRTNICIHIRYNKDAATDDGMRQFNSCNVNAMGIAFTPARLRTRMTALLLDAKDHVMYTDDILNALGFNAKSKMVKKWYHRTIDDLCNRNIFRKVLGAKNTSKIRTSRCIQLVDPEEASKELRTSVKTTMSKCHFQLDDETRLKGGAGLVMKLKDGHQQVAPGQYYDSTVEAQIVDVLGAAGSKGITQKEIMFLLSFGEHKAMHRTLEIMESIKPSPESYKYMCSRILEFEGRLRRYRYYSYQAYRKLKDDVDIEITGPPLYEIPTSKLKEFVFTAREPEVPPARGSNPEKSSDTPAVRSKRQPREVSRQDDDNAEPSSSQSATLAPIFQRQTRAAKSIADNETDQSESTSSKPVTRKRTRRGSVTAQETTEPPVKKKRGRPPKQRVNAESTPSQPPAQAEAQASSEPQAVSESPAPAEPPARKTRASSKQSTSTEPPVKRKPGRPRKQPLNAETSSSQQSHPSEPPASSEPQIASEAPVTTEPPARRTRASSLESAPAEPPAKKKRGRAPKKPLNASSEPQENVNATESQPSEQAEAQAPEPSSASGSQASNKQPAETATASPRARTAPPRRGNLFDYFSSSRNSPGPSSSGSAQTTQKPATEPSPPAPCSTETSGRQVVEAGQEDQQDTDMADKPSSISDSQKTSTPAKEKEKDKNVVRNRVEHAVGDNIVRTKSGIVSARHVRSGINTYQEQRQKTLLAMLETKPIYERNYDTKAEFIAKMKELYPEETVRPGLCLKTLWRTAKELEELGLARIVDTTYTNLSGTKTTRSIVIRGGLDITSPEVQQHLVYAKEKHALRPTLIRRPPKFAKIDSAVERLEERLERMEEQYSALDNKEGMDAVRMSEEIKELKANMMKATVLEQKLIDETKTDPGNWLVIATQFGFVNARMIRIKLLHQYMFGLLDQDVKGVDKDTKTIGTTTILSWMTLGKFCELVVVTDPKKELLEYTRDPESMEKHIWELPMHIRKALFFSSSKFRWHLRGYFDLMESLGLVKPIFPTPRPDRVPEAPSALADSYQILTKVALVDYRTENHEVVNTYTFTTPSDLMIYWSELQYVCTNPEALITKDKMDKLSPEVKALVKALSSLRNWTTNHIITRELRDKLNAYIDKDAKTTPYGNARLCQEIADELQVSELLVTAYYRKMKNGFERKRRVSDKLLIKQLEGVVRRRKTPRRRKAAEQNSINMSTRHVFQRTSKGSTRRRLLQARADTEDADNDKAESSTPFLDDEHEIPVVESSNQVESFRLRRFDRKNWKANEEELLIYCYVIMKHHSNTYDRRFLWNAAVPLFPGRNAAGCRNRIDRLRNVPSISEYMHRLSLLWPELYEQGLEEGAFMPESTETTDYDLLARLTFFIQRLQTVESDRQASNCSLPSTVAEIHARYTVSQSLAASKKQSIEDRFHGTSTFRSKNSALISSFLMLKSFQTTKTDTLPLGTFGTTDTHAVSMELLKIFFKMTLLTPIEVYDPFFAYAVINKQPPSAVNKAITEMRRKGVIVKPKTEREMDRRLPGTLFSISKKFLNDMACNLPKNFFLQGKEYNRFLNVHEKTMYMPVLASSGMMGCILDLISQEKMNISIYEEENVRRKHQMPIHRHRKTDQSVLDFDLELEVADIKPKLDDIQDKKLSLDISPKSSKVSALTPERMEIEWSGFYSSQPLDLRPLLKAIMDLLQEVKEAGATLVDIKDKILETLPGTKDREIIDCIDMLRSAQPPFIHRVGFDTLRYVTTAHLGSWVIQTQGLKCLIPTSSDLSELARSLADKRAQVIDPRLWIDLNGNVTKVVLEECLHVLFERIMERPGITERELRRLFDTLLSYAEIKDLLDILVGRNAVRKTTVVFTGPLKRTMFSKPRKYTKAAPDAIDRTAQTSYFAQHEYYQNLLLDRP